MANPKKLDRFAGRKLIERLELGNGTLEIYERFLSHRHTARQLPEHDRQKDILLAVDED